MEGDSERDEKFEEKSPVIDEDLVGMDSDNNPRWDRGSDLVSNDNDKDPPKDPDSLLQRSSQR